MELSNQLISKQVITANTNTVWKRSAMKTVSKHNLSHLGSDYRRNVDVYLDQTTGKLYKRTITVVKQKRNVHVMDATLVELVDGEPVYETDFGPVMSRDN